MPDYSGVIRTGRPFEWLDAARTQALRVRGLTRGCLQDEVRQPVQVVDDPVGREAQLLEGLLESVYPDGRIAERFRAGRIPPSERHKDDVLLRQLEAVYAKLICARIRLISVIRVCTDHRFEEPGQACVFRVRSQHRRAEVRERDHANAGALQLSQGFRGVRPGGEVEISVQELPSLGCR